MTGLTNLGNTCFINATLQCLFYIRELNDFLDNYNTTDLLVSEYNNLRKLMFERHACVSPNRFIHVIQHVAKEKKMDLFTQFNQNDLPEFLVFMINSFHSSMAHKIQFSLPAANNKIEEECYKMITTTYSSDYSIIIDLFYGILVSTIHTDCIVSIKPEPFFTLDLPIPTTDQVTLDNCIQLYLQPDQIQWHKDTTNEYVQATKHLIFGKLPKLLFIVFKRFDNNMHKNNTMISVPFNPIIHNQEYTLMSVCNHYGNLNGGHYTTTVHTNKWYEIDDVSISEIKEENVITKNAYCLLFRKKIM